VLSGAEDGTLRLWGIASASVGGDTIGYTTARIALLGDSGVGKTGLGWRIAHGEFREHASTHGQQFWVVDQLGRIRRDGTQCEAVLWDLAGQPDYRLIHALFLDHVDLGLLLFDPANRERPLAGVEYWMRHLRSATLRSVVGQSPPYAVLQSSAPTLLVAARCDRGTPTLSASEIEDFCRRQGIGFYVSTSARDNIGIGELIDRVKEAVPWEGLTATTTTRTFKRIKEHVLALKEASERAELLNPKELRQQLENSDNDWHFTDAELLTAVGHLANHGYVARLQRSSGEEAILLVPDLLVNLASSVILEARRHERGLGLLDEGRLLAGGYPLSELVDLSADVQAALLDAIVSLFLQRNLCFRETINDRTCLVFPSLINEKRPLASDRGSTDDVSYRVSGAIETVYAALVVQLGYTNLFRRDHHWQHQAQYELDPGEICCFRQTAEGDGEIELVLSFSPGTAEETRKLFQGAFERFLKRRPVHILRLPAVICSEGHAQERVAVRKAIENSRLFFFCDTCGEKLPTPKLDNIGVPAEEYIGVVHAAEATADQRTRYEVALAWVKAFQRDRGHGDSRPTCFISYAWGDPHHERWVEQLADYLQNADIAVIFDRWHCMPGSDLGQFIERIEASDFVCAIGTSRYLLKDEMQNEDPVVQAELGLIKARRMKRREIRSTIIPLLCEGTQQTAFPPLLRNAVAVDFRKEAAFFAHLFELVLTLHRIPLEDNMARQHRGALLGELSLDATSASGPTGPYAGSRSRKGLLGLQIRCGRPGSGLSRRPDPR
jgi:GTPase SAR1 family protein